MRSVQRTGAPTPAVVRSGGWSARVAPWQGRRRTAQLVPFAGSPVPTADALAAVVADLASHGYDEVLTTALAPPDQRAYLGAGFEPYERLHLLTCALDDVDPPAGAVTLRRPRRTDWPAVVAVDGRAFTAFWHLDGDGIADAVRATPSARMRVAVTGAVAGYAVTGRSGHRGYVQRLAVDPAHAGRGIGSDLLRDGLRWLRARGATSALVNTQVGNERALALYHRHGFVDAGHDLTVLRRRVEPS